MKSMRFAMWRVLCFFGLFPFPDFYGRERGFLLREKKGDLTMKRRVICSALLLSLSLVSGLAAQPVNETNRITDMSEPAIISERVISGEEQPEEIFSPAVDELSAETAAQEGESARSYNYIPYTGPLEDPILGSKEGIVKAVSYPEKFDSRTNATVTSVKNQYQTGSCWAHATMAASESSLIKSGMATDSLDLSEFQLAYFLYDKPFDPLGNISDDLMSITPNTAASKLNIGGNAVSAMWHLATWSGPVAESKAPSITGTSHTDTTSTLASSLRNTSLYHIKEGKVVAFEQENKDAIKQLIMQYGGVTASYYYASGWEKEVGDTLTYYNPSKTSSNHAVEIVGWDDTYPVANFLGSDCGYTPSCPGAWLCKNSWGSGNGRGDGYFWLSYGTIVYYADCVAFSYEDSSLYQNIYQYDGSIYSSSLLTSDSYVMNVYTAKGNPGGFEKIDAVGLGTGANGTYHIQIYVNPVFADNAYLSDYKDLLTYDYKSEITDFSSVYQGYYSIPLQEPVYVNEGDTFAVVVHCDTDSSIACTRTNTYTSTDTESNVTVSATDTRSEGQCFYSDSGSMWKDYQDTCTFRIKAFTNPVAKPSAPVQVIMEESEITLGRNYDGTGTAETKQLSAALSPQDAVGGLRYRSSDPTVATVSNTGLVKAVGAGTCIVTASYLDGTSASCEVTVQNRYQISISLTLDGEDWDGGTEHVITLRDEEGNSYPNHSYVVPGSYTVYDNDTETSTVFEVTAYGMSVTWDYVTNYFYNYDGTLLHEQITKKYATPVYQGPTPEKPADSEYTYVFFGWTPSLSWSEQSYTAVFSSVVKPQKVTFALYRDSVLWEGSETPQIEFSSTVDASKIYQNGDAAPAGKYRIIVDGTRTNYTFTTVEKQPVVVPLHFYTATFLSDTNGTVLQKKAYLPGTMPVYEGVTPTKESDTTYDYTFSGWSDEIELMGQEPVVYTAVYSPSYRPQYVDITATLDNDTAQEDRITLYAVNELDPITNQPKVYRNHTSVPVGTYALYWGDEAIQKTIQVLPGESYQSSVALYTVIFENEDHLVLQKNIVAKDATVQYEGDVPVKTADQAYRYTFEEWSDVIAPISAPTTYTALYKKEALPQTATIHCSLSNNDIPTSATVEISFRSLSDAKETYQNGALLPIGTYAVYVNGNNSNRNISLTPGESYEDTIQFYLVQFIDEVSDQILKEAYYAEGETPSISDDLIIEHTDDDTYRYEVIGWDRPFEEVHAVQKYVFQVTATPIVREVDLTCYLNDTIWASSDPSDESYLQMPCMQVMHMQTGEKYENHSSVPAGVYEILAYERHTKVTIEVAENSGLNHGSLSFYTVTFVDDAGNVLQSDIALQGEAVSFRGEEPEKENTAQNSYRFCGWTPEVAAVRGKQTYQAVYTVVPTEVGVRDATGLVVYFPSFEEAFAYASSLEEVTYVLMKDIDGISLPGGYIFRLDLNGNAVWGDIVSNAPAADAPGTSTILYLTDESPAKSGYVTGNVSMGSNSKPYPNTFLHNEVSISGMVLAKTIINSGYINTVEAFTDTVTNQGNVNTINLVAKDTILKNMAGATIACITRNDGLCQNAGTIQSISENYGKVENSGEILYGDPNISDSDVPPDDEDENEENEEEEEEENSYEIGDRFVYDNAIYEVAAGHTAIYRGHKKATVKSVKIPATVRSNGEKFTVTQIGMNAFKNRRSLTKITLPKTIRVIGDSAFQGCNKLTKMTIPAKVTTIGKKAFYNCTKLKSITVKTSSLKQVGKYAFQKIAKKATIKIPKKKHTAYKRLLKGKTTSDLIWKKA